MILADDEPGPSVQSPARTLTLITTADGTRYLVDPNTDAGRAAIAEAQRNGSTITQVTVPTSPSTAVASENPSTSFTLPPNGILPIDPGSTLDDTLTTVSSILGSTQSTVSSILGSTQSTVTSIVGSTQSTVATVVTTVTGVVSTVSSTVGGVVTTVTVPAPLTSLLGQVGSTGSSVTTTPTTVDTDPICTLLDC